MADSNSTRREFLETAAASGAALGLSGLAAAQEPANGTAAGGAPPGRGLPTRPLGRTGVRVSMLCLGGWHIGSVREENEAIRIMHAAIDEGLTFFDNAWDYHDGHSETIMGRALAMNNRRQQVFLMTKCCGRDAKTARQHLDDSLRRLRTDHLDLWQFHEINYDNDPDWIMDRGVLAEGQRAVREGKVRFLGFTGHKDPRIHLALLGRHTWDTVQMPINVCDYHYRSFAQQVVPEANRRNIGVIGMKSLGGGSRGRGRLVEERVCTVDEALNYALSRPIASLVSGIDSIQVLQQNLRIARAYPALDAQQLQALITRVRPAAGDGRHERFKSTQFYDGIYHRRQHGLTEQEIQDHGQPSAGTAPAR
jgi:aryl-alcohol dehydrogenase-like predicted oxidoreductase